VDTVTHVEVEVNMKHGPKTKCMKVPMTVVMEEDHESNAGTQDNPDLAPEWDMQEPQVANEPIRPQISMVSF